MAKTYLACGADQGDEFHAIGSALTGSEEKAVVYQELVDAVIEMFVEVLKPHSNLRLDTLALSSLTLVASGDALTNAMNRGSCSALVAEEVFTKLIGAAIQDIL